MIAYTAKQRAILRLAHTLADVTGESLPVAAGLAGQYLAGASMRLPGGDSLYSDTDRLTVARAVETAREAIHG